MTDTLLPIVAKDLIDKLDPRWINCRMLAFSPTAILPRTEHALAMRQKLRKERELPKWTPSRTLNEVPMRRKDRVEIVEPTVRKLRAEIADPNLL